MGLYIRLYRVKQSTDIHDIENIKNVLDNAKMTCLDLDKIYHHILILLKNQSDPYIGEDSIENKIILGNFTELAAGDRTCIGFIPANEISEINEWFRENNIYTQNGFDNFYDSLDENVKLELFEFGSPDKNEMYQLWIEGLVAFYKTAEENKNSVVVCAE